MAKAHRSTSPSPAPPARSATRSSTASRRGQLLGPDQPIVLRLLEIEPAMAALEGVVMELEDGAHPLLDGIEATVRPAARVRRRVVGAARRLDPPQGGDGARRPAVGQRRDLQAAGRGDQRARRRRRACARRRQPVQHELPDRPVERARRAGRPLVRDDAPRREPRARPSSRTRPACRCATSRTSRSGATTRRRSSPTSRTPQIGGQARTRRDRRRRVAAGRVHRDGAEARCRGDRQARRVVGGVGRARGDRVGATASWQHDRRRATGTRSRS